MERDEKITSVQCVGGQQYPTCPYCNPQINVNPTIIVNVTSDTESSHERHSLKSADKEVIGAIASGLVGLFRIMSVY